MGSQARNKADRNNMKVIVKDLLNDVLFEELSKKIVNEVTRVLIEHTNKHLGSIEEYIKIEIGKIEENHKTVMSGVLRAGTPLYENK